VSVPLGIRILEGAALVAFAAFALHLAVGPAGLDSFFADWVYNAIILAAALLCAARAAADAAERAPWALLALALMAWLVGEVHFSTVLRGVDPTPFPTIGDAAFILFYPATYAGIALLVRERLGAVPRGVWIDGAIAALGVAAIGAALLLGPFVERARGESSALAAVTNLAYPLGDLVLLGLVAGVFAVTAWRPGRVWLAIGAGLMTAALADVTFVLQSARGAYEEGGPLDALWPGALLLMGVSAWMPSPAGATVNPHGPRVTAMPAACAAGALAVLVAGSFGEPVPLALLLATVTLALVVLRMALNLSENTRLLAESREEALRDPLTGLGNRRRLMADLSSRMGSSTSQPDALVLFDLDGFKAYNDAFGHPAGDAMLARLAAGLRECVGSQGEAYRLAGDEFCVIVDVRGDELDTLVDEARKALSERGASFSMSASRGVALLPEEADEASGALHVADQRMYADKDSRRRPVAAVRQARDLLLQVLHEREPELENHVREVAELASATAHRLGLHPGAADEVARAAELHDVGKTAIPDVILHKPGPLDEEEWGFMRRHTLLGERILAAVPALRGVAALVRSSHERFDGRGYPDRLSGAEIPLGSRILFACDAFQAMTSDRPYQRAMTHVEAQVELRRGAGTQFDPAVVEALVETWRGGPVATLAGDFSVAAEVELSGPRLPRFGGESNALRR
jgi:two-component system cell cycle response regulator